MKRLTIKEIKTTYPGAVVYEGAVINSISNTSEIRASTHIYKVA